MRFLRTLLALSSGLCAACMSASDPSPATEAGVDRAEDARVDPRPSAQPADGAAETATDCPGARPTAGSGCLTDPSGCRCYPCGAVVCAEGAHWDALLCYCAPDESDDGSTTAIDPRGCRVTEICSPGAHYEPSFGATWDGQRAPGPLPLCRCVGEGDAASTVPISEMNSTRCAQDVLCATDAHWEPRVCGCVKNP